MQKNGVDHVKTRPLSKKVVDESGQNVTDYVDLTQIPSFAKLRERVQLEVDSSTWFERYGIDWIVHIGATVAWFLSHFLLASSSWSVFILGIVIMGFCHATLSLKAGHGAIHCALSGSKLLDQSLTYFFSDFIGTFSADVGYSIHIKCHHPHTNIVGLGDSSTWKAPFVPSFLYMFVTPLTLPVLTPLVSIKELLADGSMLKFVRYILIAGAGIWSHIYLLTNVSNLTIGAALLVMYVNRNLFSIPYIHVNIFQHIGLPMYSQKYRPVRLYQMYSGVLNIPRNPFLDYCFGHGIVSAHIEHHLFPHLSDNMCLKIKPVVKSFCQEYDLPYHEDSYAGRAKHFIKNYEALMVNAPPVTSFVGLQ